MLIIGQGSTRCCRPDALLARHAVALAKRGRFAEVRAATLAGTPNPQEALASIRSRNIVIVPVLMCDGFLYREALPAALDHARRTRPKGHPFYLCRPLGLHPKVADLLTYRAIEALDPAVLTPAATTLLLIGHGSTRDSASETAVARQAARIQTASIFRSVMTAFIAQPPYLRDVLAAAPRPLIGMALFTARGNHVIEDIEKPFDEKDDGRILFGGTLGEDDQIVAIIEAMAAEELVR